MRSLTAIAPAPGRAAAACGKLPLTRRAPDRLPIREPMKPGAWK